jgi:exodeoxyribonuclease VII large subunit
VAFEQLKTELKSKGYFDVECKKALPRFPAKIAMVTAAGGAALQDMLKVARKRWPGIAISVVDVLVQGEAAAGEIARGIAYADTLEADIIITGRGGGSQEDLWAFNEREVAEAIYGAKTPVVSAVGHEVDTLISDFVADLRAPTPSAAMEMILPDYHEWLQSLDLLAQQMEQQICQIIQRREEGLTVLSALFHQRSPMRQLAQIREHFGHVQEEFGRTIRYRLEHFSQKVQPLASRMDERIGMILRQQEASVVALGQTLIQYDPEKRSKEGFAEIVKEGKRVALETIEVGEEFMVTDTKVKMRVRSLEKLGMRN